MHSSRNPKVTGRRHCEVDFRNNVIYNWGFNSCYDGTASYINWANNYYKAGPGTSDKVRGRIFELDDGDIEAEGNNSPEDSQKYETSLFADGNYVHGFPAITADNWNGGIDFKSGASEEKSRALVAFDYPPITEQTAEVAYPLVLASAGASKARDVIDKRIIDEVTTGKTTFGNHGHIDTPSDVGGWPIYRSSVAPVDYDLDGMPDIWETKNGLNPKNAEDRNHYDLNADYTNLEVYLNSLVAGSQTD